MNPSSDGSPSMFVLEQVSKGYAGTVALAPLSLELRVRERVAILGPSGSGKTTLLHLLGGVIQPDQGRILIEGRPLANMGPGQQLASLVGVMHQQFDLVPHLPVIHNILAGRLGHWGLWRSLISLVSARERHLAEEALKRVGLGDKLYERTSRLSGGEQQRVAMARILVQHPRVILADEPIASLDPTRAEDLIQLISTIATESGKTLIASLHSIHLARNYFSRAIGLRKGKIQFDILVEELTDEILDGLYQLQGVQGQGQA